MSAKRLDVLVSALAHSHLPRYRNRVSALWAEGCVLSQTENLGAVALYNIWDANNS